MRQPSRAREAWVGLGFHELYYSSIVIRYATSEFFFLHVCNLDPRYRLRAHQHQDARKTIDRYSFLVQRSTYHSLSITTTIYKIKKPWNYTMPARNLLGFKPGVPSKILPTSQPYGLPPPHLPHAFNNCIYISCIYISCIYSSFGPSSHHPCHLCRAPPHPVPPS